MPRHDDHDDLSALDFSAPADAADQAGPDDSDALDFSAADVTVEESAVDAFDDFAPTEPEGPDTELAALASAAEAIEEEQDEEDGLELFTVTNPLDTVSVSALMDGRTYRVTLSPKVTNMTETELAEEICVLAELAHMKGMAGQYSYVLDHGTQAEGLDEVRLLGVDSQELIRGFMENEMHFPSPEQADAAQAEVFATRYATDK